MLSNFGCERCRLCTTNFLIQCEARDIMQGGALRFVAWMKPNCADLVCGFRSEGAEADRQVPRTHVLDAVRGSQDRGRIDENAAAPRRHATVSMQQIPRGNPMRPMILGRSRIEECPLASCLIGTRVVDTAVEE